MRVVDSFSLIAIPASEMLFFLHVRAVYPQPSSRMALYPPVAVHHCELGGDCNQRFDLHVDRIHKYCINGLLASYVTAAAVVPLVNDSVLFGALALRMLRSSYQERSLKGDIKAMVFGEHLPMVSRALLQNGQAYFLLSKYSADEHYGLADLPQHQIRAF
ncbi:hypothetical protein D9619_009327 [Psilocybe cf. subviscida]|uniref:Uncharacterized protein n=1 Tax=Psilocybe cf. subviscida TaxID=2480587 RepID=A0A8H5BTZ6_9AGAR|nr:hypothetical protein D9619_009327 [Psilocybe cf. subviscida]